MNEEVLQEEVIQGPGQMLREAREQAQLSIQDIAALVRLKPAVIEGIEQDNYDINLSQTFVKGYLKLYAKQVKVNEADVLNAFENLNTQKKEPAKLQSFSRRLATQANDDKLMLVTYLILAAVIALVVVWWFQQSSNEQDVTSAISGYSEPSTEQDSQILEPELEQADVEPVVEPTLAADNGGQYSAIENENIAENAEPSISPQTVTSSPEPADTPEETAQAETQSNELATVDTAVNTAEPVELVFEFAGDCWMNLADATGENIAYGVKVKGRRMPVTGIPPFEITLGAPEVVKISYDGQPIDMSFLPAGRIAKFALPRTE